MRGAADIPWGLILARLVPDLTNIQFEKNPSVGERHFFCGIANKYL